MKVSDIKVNDNVELRSMLTGNKHIGHVIYITDQSVIYKVEGGTMSFPKNHMKHNIEIKINNEVLL